MKELSIEQKAKTYDNAFNVALETYQTQPMYRDWLEKMFPELKESEDKDERIRKELIVHCRNIRCVTEEGAERIAKWITWLEKQGEHANFRNKIQIGDKVTRNEDGVLVNLSQLNRVAKVEEKQGEQKPADYEKGHIQQNDFAPKSAMEAVNEEKVDNQNCIKSYAQEHIGDKVESKFKVGDKVIGIISGIQYYIIEVCDNHYRTESGCIIMFGAQDNFELVEQQLKKIEQKPTDEEIKELLRTEYEKGRADAIAEMQRSWSEEDEEHIKSLLERLEGMCKKDATFIRTKFAVSEDEDWLKSLSPQSRWKPSEKLLDVFIKNAIDFFESNFNPLTDGGVIGAFDDKEKMIEEFKEYMREEGFNEEWI